MVWPSNATGSVVRRQWRIRPSTGRGETLSEDRSDSTSRPSHSNFTDWRRRLHWSYDVAARSTVVYSSLDGVWFSEWLVIRDVTKWFVSAIARRVTGRRSTTLCHRGWSQKVKGVIVNQHVIQYSYSTDIDIHFNIYIGPTIIITWKTSFQGRLWRRTIDRDVRLVDRKRRYRCIHRLFQISVDIMSDSETSAGDDYGLHERSQINWRQAIRMRSNLRNL